jgi:hypothetical protein
LLLSSEDEKDDPKEGRRVNNNCKPFPDMNMITGKLIKEDENDHSSMTLSSETNELLLSSLDSSANSLFHLDADEDDDDDNED